MAATVTLSSVGTSNAILLDYIGAKTATIALTLTSTSMTADFTVQCTLDDPNIVSSPIWFNASTTHYSSGIADDGKLVTFLTPVAAVRINSTAISSSSIRMQALQNAGG